MSEDNESKDPVSEEKPVQDRKPIPPAFQYGAIFGLAGVFLLIISSRLILNNFFLSWAGFVNICIGLYFVYFRANKQDRTNKILGIIIIGLIGSMSTISFNNSLWQDIANRSGQTCSFATGQGPYNGTSAIAIGFKYPVYHWFIAWGLNTSYFIMEFRTGSGLSVSCPGGSVQQNNFTLGQPA